MEYRYMGINSEGKKVKGRIRADNQWLLISQLKSQDIFCIKYKEINENIITFQKRISQKYLGVFCKIMKNNLKAGISLITSLELVATQSDNKVLASSIDKAISYIKKGSTLKESLSNDQRGFPKLFITMISIGEESGNLQQVFQLMEKYYIKEYNRTKKLINMMIYPMFVIIVAIIMSMVIIAKILPNFFKNMNMDYTDLPKITRFYMAISNGMNKLGVFIIPLVITIIVVSCLACRYLKKNNVIEEFIYKVPLIRKFQLKKFYCRFTLSLSMMIGSGVDIKSALVALKSCEDVDYINKKLYTCIRTLEEGLGLYDGIKKLDIFPKYFLIMISMGEENGSLEEVLLTSNEEFEEDLQVNIEKVMKLIEPLITILAGMVVGSIVLAVMLPLFSMYNVKI
ncbi:MAG: type II secretion system F family protein [Clostridium sp.]|uniref:type II secretion system F family protein n=1 Tax=Clostridium sp. TaxID=1506 RepID=UPI00303FFDC9